jgi:23S rRNA (uracil1939-C5)-methyltransferase
MTHWPETLELTLDGIAQGGEGVGRWDGRVVFVGGGLPGERVRVRLHERRDSYARGEAVAILEASPDRVAPRVEGADWMPWQHIEYAAQVRFKRQILADQLAKIGGFGDVTVGETLPAARPWEYRNSAHFHCDGARIGYYAAGTRRLQEVRHDPLLHPALNEVLAALHTVRDDSMPRCEIALRVSESNGYVLATLKIPDQRQPTAYASLRALASRWRAQCPALAGVTLRSTPPIPLGAPYLVEEFGGLDFQLSPMTFFQVNRSSAEQLLGLLRSGLQLRSSDMLLDLYCGAGAFALPLSSSVAEVLGVEEFAGSIADARATAEAHEITNVRFEVGAVERVLEHIDDAFSVAVLDPPRRGCHPLALENLVKIGPARIAYVSCHPATLARDLKILAGHGYRLVSVQPVDLFPQTPHIESVTMLQREA